MAKEAATLHRQVDSSLQATDVHSGGCDKRLRWKHESRPRKPRARSRPLLSAPAAMWFIQGLEVAEPAAERCGGGLCRLALVLVALLSMHHAHRLRLLLVQLHQLGRDRVDLSAEGVDLRVLARELCSVPRADAL